MQCKQCGGEFEPKQNNWQKFCSIQCQRKYHNELRPKKPLEEKHCLHCGTVFKTSNTRKKFCNRNCDISYYNHRQPRRGPITAICKYCGVEFTTVASRAGVFCSKECRINFFSHQRGSGKLIAINKLRNIPLTPEQLSFIVGTVLGDASMRCRVNASLIISHSIKQEDYLLWKLAQVPFIFQNTPCLYSYKNKPLQLLKATSIAHLDLTTIYHEIYINGRKTITENLLNRYVDERALSFWFQDDGSYCELATHNYSLKENEIIKSFLSNRFNIETRIQYHKPRKTSFGLAKEAYSIRFSRSEFRKFASLIRPFMHHSLLYKLK